MSPISPTPSRTGSPATVLQPAPPSPVQDGLASRTMSPACDADELSRAARERVPSPSPSAGDDLTSFLLLDQLNGEQLQHLALTTLCEVTDPELRVSLLRRIHARLTHLRDHHEGLGIIGTWIRNLSSLLKNGFVPAAATSNAIAPPPEVEGNERAGKKPKSSEEPTRVFGDTVFVRRPRQMRSPSPLAALPAEEEDEHATAYKSEADETLSDEEEDWHSIADESEEDDEYVAAGKSEADGTLSDKEEDLHTIAEESEEEHESATADKSEADGALSDEEDDLYTIVEESEEAGEDELYHDHDHEDEDEVEEMARSILERFESKHRQEIESLQARIKALRLANEARIESLRSTYPYSDSACEFLIRQRLKSELRALEGDAAWIDFEERNLKEEEAARHERNLKEEEAARQRGGGTSAPAMSSPKRKREGGA